MGLVHSVFARSPPAYKAEELNEDHSSDSDEEDVVDEKSFYSERTPSLEREVQVASGTVVATSIADDVLDNNFKFEPLCSQLSMNESCSDVASTPSVSGYPKSSSETDKFSIISGSGLDRQVQTPEKLIGWLDTLETPQTPMSSYQTPQSRTTPLKRHLHSSLLNSTVKDFDTSPENLEALTQSELEVSRCSPVNSGVESPKKKKFDEPANQASTSIVNTPKRNVPDAANASMSAADISPGLQTYANVLLRGETPSRRIKEDDRYPKLVSGADTPRNNQEETKPVRQRLRASTRTRVTKNYYED